MMHVFSYEHNIEHNRPKIRVLTFIAANKRFLNLNKLKILQRMLLCHYIIITLHIDKYTVVRDSCSLGDQGVLNKRHMMDMGHVFIILIHMSC